jgi:hypothetical protein
VFAPPLQIVAPPSVEICSSFWAAEVPLSVERPKDANGNDVEGTVDWRIVKAPEGATATLVRLDGDKAKVVFRGFCEMAPTTSQLVVQANLGEYSGETKVEIRRGRAKVLLVDDDRSSNNTGSPGGSLSASDELYRKLLQQGDGLKSIVYDVVTVERYSHGPSLDFLNQYEAIVWYTGAEYGGNPDNTAVISDQDMENLMAWMRGGRSLVIFSPGLINNLQGYVRSARSNEEKWIKCERPFMTNLLGLQGGQGLLHRFNPVEVQAENGVKFSLAGRSPIECQISPVNPRGARPLMFALLNPDGNGDRWVPCATAYVTGDIRAVYVGFTLENIHLNVGEAFRLLVAPAFGWGAAPPPQPDN